jgi:hypothetical protein
MKQGYQKIRKLSSSSSNGIRNSPGFPFRVRACPRVLEIPVESSSLGFLQNLTLRAL